MERLQSMHISVVGAGAVGDEIVQDLVQLGVGAIDVHDLDPDVPVRALECDVWCTLGLAEIARRDDLICAEVFRFSLHGRCACFECHRPHRANRKFAERRSCGWRRRAMLAEGCSATTAITAGDRPADHQGELRRFARGGRRLGADAR